MSPRSFLLVLILLSEAALAAQLASAATVAVVATSNLGDALKPKIHLYELGSHRDHWPETGQTATSIPFGYYEIEVVEPGFRHFARAIDIIDDHTDVRVVLSPSNQERPRA